MKKRISLFVFLLLFSCVRKETNHVFLHEYLNELKVPLCCKEDFDKNEEVNKTIFRMKKIRLEALKLADQKMFFEGDFSLNETMNTNGIWYKMMIYSEKSNTGLTIRSEYPFKRYRDSPSGLFFLSNDTIPCCSSNFGLDNRFVSIESKFSFLEEKIIPKYSKVLFW